MILKRTAQLLREDRAVGLTKVGECKLARRAPDYSTQ